MEFDLGAELKREVDGVWSETIRLLPLAGAGAGADADRSPVEVAAILRTGDREAERQSFGRGRMRQAGMMTQGGQLRIDRAAYPDLLLRARDKIVALDRPGQPVFEIQAVDDRSHLRLICELGDAS